MGKPTGFLEYTRCQNRDVPALERVKNYEELHQPLTEEFRREQAARCMDCGVPFCQSNYGCPLHNLIPEWNDLIYRGEFDSAVKRLLMTNNFPEFTSRVCPALCENACICNLHGSPVTTRDNENFVIEHAFASGLMQAKSPVMRSGKHVAVIGSGPAGLAAADQLNKRGHSVTVFERSDKIGGLLMYGIPNMKLDKSIIQRRVKLMQEEGIEFKLNSDIGKNKSAISILKKYDAVILACGASQPRDLNVAGRNVNGVHFAVDYLTNATKMLLNKQNPADSPITAKNKKVIIVGGGDTGNDCVATAIRQGAVSVMQLEMNAKLPDSRTADNPFPEWARICKTDYGQEEAIAVFGQDPRIYETTVKECYADENGNLKSVRLVKVCFENNAETGKCELHEGETWVVDADLLIIAIGFLGAEAYVAEAFGVERNARTNIETLSDSHATAVPKVFTAGDMHTGQSLVVRAIAEGRAVAKEVDNYLMGYTNLT
ncbi:MAG: glutamate synthase subunit beta [Oscillospiraceae bacterium]|nr:glutamate synthase subunit beta [Oscillospiraceae bacterium]